MAEPIRIAGGVAQTANANQTKQNIQVQVDDFENLQVIEGIIDNTNKVFEDTSFVSGDSPVTLDVNAALGRNSIDGYIVCDGPGNIKVQISRDGLSFDEQWTMKKGEITTLEHLSIDKIKITHVSDSAYRVNVI